MWLGPVTFPAASAGAWDHTAKRPPCLSMVITAKSLPTTHRLGGGQLNTVARVHVCPKSTDRFTVTWSVATVWPVLLYAVWTAKTWPDWWVTGMFPGAAALQAATP